MSQVARFPAEWEAQSAVLVAWPHAGTDWADRLESVEASFVALAAAITRFEIAIVLVPDAAIETHARALLAGHADFSRLRFEHLSYDDTWLRDSGPISLREDHGFRLLDFHFTAWGGKFEAGQDDRIVATLCERGLFGSSPRQRIEFALEGGAIETDGAGTLMSTWTCLHERHPESSREDLTRQLQGWLHQHRTLWLNHGYLEGDDTDAHIDTLARFAAPDAIVYQGCQDPGDRHYDELRAMAAELAQFRRDGGEPYRLFELPWAKPILDDGRRLAASYANFLIVNGAVLAPVYDDPADAEALRVLGEAFPGRKIVPVPCRPLIWQNGSLHCLTMQLPEGLLA